MAVGVDRPGIVAAVTGVFVEQGCNIEDSSMTVLQGHFAMMLVVTTPEATTSAVLDTALGAPASQFDLVVAVRAFDGEASDRGGEENEPAAEGIGYGDDEASAWTVSVHGADHPGIVHGVASFLASRSVNIVDLGTRVVGPDEGRVYSMVLEVELPAGIDSDGLSTQLRQLGDQLGVVVTLHRADADIL